MSDIETQDADRQTYSPQVLQDYRAMRLMEKLMSEIIIEIVDTCDELYDRIYDPSLDRNMAIAYGRVGSNDADGVFTDTISVMLGEENTLLFNIRQTGKVWQHQFDFQDVMKDHAGDDAASSKRVSHLVDMLTEVVANLGSSDTASLEAVLRDLERDYNFEVMTVKNEVIGADVPKDKIMEQDGSYFKKVKAARELSRQIRYRVVYEDGTMDDNVTTLIDKPIPIEVGDFIGFDAKERSYIYTPKYHVN